MSDLLATVADAGYPEAVSVVASGNIIVSSDIFVDTDAVVAAIEANHGFTSEIFARLEHEVRVLPKINPFAGHPGKVEVVFLPESPSRSVIDKVAEIATGPDLLRVVGSEIFWHRPLPLQPSIPKETDLRKAIETASTRRTLATVERVIAKLDLMSP